MYHYIMRRIAISIPTLIGVTLLIFGVMRILPGDPTSVMFGTATLTVLSESDQQRFREDLGLDDPLYQQYLSWMGDIATGDLGHSFWRTDSIADMIVTRGPISVQIALMAIVISWLIGIPLGILSAVKRNSLRDNAIRGFAAIFLAIPEFWLAVVAILIGVLYFSWRPPVELTYLWENPWTNFQMTIGPALAMGMVAGAYLTRITRSSVLEVFHSDYVRTARAKGLAERLVVLRHGFRNAAIPLVTLMALDVPFLFTGALFTEVIFAWPGMGRLFYAAAERRDYGLLMAIIMITSVLIIFANILADMVYALLDPRIRLS
jgi:peptide/nickel transport system permease protein